MAPPLPLVMPCPVALPLVKVRFCTVSRGVSWFWQCDVVQVSFWSQVFMYRMRRLPAPLSVTLPPPSRTTRLLVLCTRAVAVILIVTGFGPQLKVMTPPSQTALTTAFDVQLAGVPCPMTWFGCAVLTARAAGGT